MSPQTRSISGNIVDCANGRIYPGTVTISDGRIAGITEDRVSYDTYLVPGFVDSHIHIESSMLTPSEFARAAVVHGTVAVVSDPHEIANVMGSRGVLYMIEDGATVPMKFYFSAPSCVPATPFETSGAMLDAAHVEELLTRNDIRFLGEVMNFPGVLKGNPDIMQKIACARAHAKLIDGHAPGLSGEELAQYHRAGITTNHECLSYEDAIANIKAGIYVQVRKGSAAHVFDRWYTVIDEHPDFCMFCSDDKHPDDLVRGHVNEMVKDAVRYGVDVMKVLKAAAVNPVRHYGLDVGLLQVGDSADFLEIDNLTDFTVHATWIDGTVVARNGETLIPRSTPVILNNFAANCKTPADFIIAPASDTIPVMVALDGQLITDRITAAPKLDHGHAVSDPARDILKITVVNRYKDAPPAIGFIKNFGLKKGAIASSVAHDSHNIVAVGVNDEELCRAVNLIITHKGGICAVDGPYEMMLPLPIAGIISDEDCTTTARHYTDIEAMAHSLGSTLKAPFMTLSFMSLPVIPKLKLTDQGLFDVEKFKYI